MDVIAGMGDRTQGGPNGSHWTGTRPFPKNKLKIQDFNLKHKGSHHLNRV